MKNPIVVVDVFTYNTPGYQMDVGFYRKGRMRIYKPSQRCYMLLAGVVLHLLYMRPQDFQMTPTVVTPGWRLSIRNASIPKL
jgi:hypothetical protein